MAVQVDGWSAERLLIENPKSESRNPKEIKKLKPKISSVFGDSAFEQFAI
jgi:hypothetical protein